ncbi:hypothetical protein, partial [Ornithobacterium rhinotracheale]
MELDNYPPLHVTLLHKAPSLLFGRFGYALDHGYKTRHQNDYLATAYCRYLPSCLQWETPTPVWCILVFFAFEIVNKS